MGTPYTFDEGMSCHSIRIELFYFDDNFRRIAQWVPPFRVGWSRWDSSFGVNKARLTQRRLLKTRGLSGGLRQGKMMNL